ncbi:MAG TPA: hypothetical protein VGK36_00165 [Candidatus Angelobacter sp.]|jgi:hypothetical protein
MEPSLNNDVRRLCKAVAEETNPDRIKTLLDQLFDLLDERQLLASLL